MAHHLVDNMQSFELIQDHEMAKIWSIRAAAFWSDQKYALNLFRWHAHAPPPRIRESAAKKYLMGSSMARARVRAKAQISGMPSQAAPLS